MGSPTRGNNPFVVDTEYPSLLEDNSQDDLVPAIVPAVQPAQPSQPASRPAPPAASTLQFTDSGLSNAPVLGRIQQPGSAPAPSRPANPPPSVNDIQTAATPLPEEPFDSTQYPLYNVRRYRKFFNVDTKDVLWRLTNSVLGPFKADFLETTWDCPDLYGPFWVATTLVFVTAVAGNYNSYLQYRHDVKNHDAAAASLANKQWYNDASKMSYSALMFYGYIFCLGLTLYFALRWFKADIKLANVWCIYGYSLSVFIPVSFLCIIPINWFKWSLVGAATLSSGLFLLLNFRATIYSAAPARALLLLGIMLACHLALGLAMKLYFFHYSVASSTPSSPAPPGKNLLLL